MISLERTLYVSCDFGLWALNTDLAQVLASLFIDGQTNFEINNLVVVLIPECARAVAEYVEVGAKYWKFSNFREVLWEESLLTPHPFPVSLLYLRNQLLFEDAISLFETVHRQ
ncbi:hypothetical protein TNCV_1442831 [Trichonephila clavipes]|nr:hypothetical protein TNCV_1442831 [Trichonephila clavipes]